RGLGVNWWTGPEWNWSDQGMPAGHTVDDAVGTISYQDCSYEAEDGIRGWSVTGLQTCAHPIWSDQGAPPGEIVGDAVGAISYQDRPYVFVRGSDGHLWVNWWTGKTRPRCCKKSGWLVRLGAAPVDRSDEHRVWVLVPGGEGQL